MTITIDQNTALSTGIYQQPTEKVYADKLIVIGDSLSNGFLSGGHLYS